VVKLHAVWSERHGLRAILCRSRSAQRFAGAKESVPHPLPGGRRRSGVDRNSEPVLPWAI